MKSISFFSFTNHKCFALIFLVALIAYFLTANEWFFSCSILLFILACSVLLSFVASKWLVMLLAFVVPLSVQTDIGFAGINLFFPSELLTAILAATLLVKIIKGEFAYHKFFHHPITLLITAYFFLTVLTGIFSSMPVVSSKAIIVKGTYFIVFYFMVFDAIEKEKSKTSVWFLICYGISLVVVIAYSISFFTGWSFDKKAADLAVLPFYKDHTIYSACVAFLMPVFAIKFFSSIREKKYTAFVFYFTMLAIFITGLIFSFSRAAWISIFTAFIFALVLFLKIRPVILIIVAGLFSVLMYQKTDDILIAAGQNRSDSNRRNADLEMQTKSISNISTDQSNAERINRWKCALRMFREKPFTGFGSGTYMFQYFPFQRKADMTFISVTKPYDAKQGHGGSVHSEYLLVLSENGIFTFLSFMTLIVFIFLTGIKNAYYHPEKNKRTEAITLLVALVTYLVHGLFNNFLDTDKAAFLFWSSACILVAIDLSRKKTQQVKI